MNVQQTMNRSGLNGQLAVCVLEGCDVVREYREDIEALVDEIREHLGHWKHWSGLIVELMKDFESTAVGKLGAETR